MHKMHPAWLHPWVVHVHTHAGCALLGGTCRQFVSLEDFECFFPDNPELARRAFMVFDVSTSHSAYFLPSRV